MRQNIHRINGVLHYTGSLMAYSSVLLLLPIILVLIYWGENGEGLITLSSFFISAFLCFLIGFLLLKIFKAEHIDTTGSLLMCALSWILISAVSALPYVIGIDASYLNAYFEAMSGFTTTGITVFSGLDDMPRSILFWRAFTQWLGGLGILSLYLIFLFQSHSSHYIFSAEAHKISTYRPRPGLFNTIKSFWAIYAGLTIFSIIIWTVEGMPFYDSICHTFTALSTGGFSPHDLSLSYYRVNGFANYRLIEYSGALIMILGGTNFLIHYRILSGKYKALWDNAEMRLWWKLIFGFTIILMIDNLHSSGFFATFQKSNFSSSVTTIEKSFRYCFFQVSSIITTTGFATKDINTAFFPALAKQLFLVMMVIGGCVASTGGGIKVFRIAVLKKLMTRELFKLRVSRNTSNRLILDGKILEDDEIHRISALFFYWILLLIIGGAITAFFSELNGWQAFSGMFSALGNIGPCYISVNDMINISPVVKITYIFGMLAGRLEIIPVLILFSRKAWLKN